MEKLTGTRSLLILQLEWLLDSESLKFKEFPQLISKISNPVFKSLVTKHFEHLENQINRLKQVFNILRIPVARKPCNAMNALLDEILEIVDYSFTHEATDAGILTGFQKVALYEITAYGSACNYAFTLGKQKAANLLHESLEEERRFDNTLSRLAEATINVQAVMPHDEISIW